MLLNSKIDISFDFGTLIVYLSGILTGIVIGSLIYLLVILLSFNKKRKIIKAMEDNIKEEDVLNMIKNSQDNYILLSKSNDDLVREAAFKDSALSLINDIAKKCFPKSKNPTLELSIDESLLLSKYVIQRVEDVLNIKGFSLIKRLTLAHLFKLWNIKKKVDNNVIVKEYKKHSKIVEMGINVASVITKPFKIIGLETKKFLLNKIILVTLNIIGEEAYKIYTKQALKSIDPEYKKLIEEIEEVSAEAEVVK